MALVLEEAVAPAGQRGEPRHHLLDDRRAGVVEAVGGLASLEEHVGVLRRAAQHRPVGRERALAVPRT